MSAAVRALVSIAAAALLCTAGANASVADGNSPLAEVRSKVAQIHYAEAGELLARVLERGGLSAPQLAEAHKLGGEIFAALGDEDRARDHFARSLVLLPGQQLPRGTSPKISAPFEQARRQVRALGPLRVRHRSLRAAGTATVGLVVDADPLEMVAGMRVAYATNRDAPLTKTIDGPGTRTIALDAPDADWLRIRVIAVDDAGNELAVIGGDDPIAIPPMTMQMDLRRTASLRVERDWYARWYTWAGAAGVAAGAGAYFGYRARSDANALTALSDNSEAHSYTEARALEARGKRNALLANVGFGAAGVATVAAIVCGLRGTSTERGTFVQPLAGAGTAGVSLQVTF